MFRRSAMLVAIALIVAVLPAGATAAPRAGIGKVPIPPAEVNDGLPPGLIQYSDIAAELNRIERTSDRVSVEVMGQSAGGRDLYLATVADPDADQEHTRMLRSLMISDPDQARALAGTWEDFRIPVMLNCSIHGNEYEGVDACLQVIERLAFEDDPETMAILENTVVLINVVQNPDGRVLNTRENANGFDLNRDFITNSQPESIATRDVVVDWNPMVFLDHHGYVNNMLIEPTTPPHNPNYEYDLYIKHAYGNALAMEQGVLGAYATLKSDPDFADDYATYIAPVLASEEQVIIPFRDWAVGDWDDWPPIFAPMYAMYHGSFGATLESPLSPRFGPLPQREARAVVNKAAHFAAAWSMLNYVVANKLEMIDDQLEVFERGQGAVGPVPVEPGFVPGFGPEDQYPSNYPEAYIIPLGDGQASDLAAAELVNFLIGNGVEVGAARAGFTFDGQAIAAGSYIVSMAQPRRGLANTVLELGYDITYNTPQMYDISGWSHGALWGATAITVPKGYGLRGQTRTVHEATVAGVLPPAGAAGYSYPLDSSGAIRATNALLDAGVALSRGPGGIIVAPGDAHGALGQHAADGIEFASLTDLPDGLEPVAPVNIAAALLDEERFVLGDLGFDFDTITTDDLNEGTFDLSAYDVLMVSDGFNVRALTPEALATLNTWLEAGGGVIGLGSTGVGLNAGVGLLDVTSKSGPNCAVANGVVAVANSPDSAVVGAFAAEDTSFVFDPTWFTDLGDGVLADQRYTTGDVLTAGHWLGDFEDWVGDTEPGGPRCDDADERTAQADAAGHASIVSGVDETGARVVLFGTDPMFRAHPHKLFAELAAAIYWTSAG